MSDLTEFILARIAEDEAAAQRVLPYMEGRGAQIAIHLSRTETLPDSSRRTISEIVTPYDPARVLTQCAALREVVELHRVRVDLYETDYCAACAGGVESGGPGDEAVHDPEPWPCDTLRTLASIWSSHPDYPLED